MEISFTTYRIKLQYTFGISRSKSDWYDIVLVFIQDGAIIGRGEAAPSFRYNESTEGKHVFFARVLSNPLASGWQFFETEKEAFTFGINHISKYLKETE